MPVGATIAAGAMGAAGSAYAADRQADAAEQAAARQTALGREQLQYTRELNEPYQQVGTQALNALSGTMGLGGEEPDFSRFRSSPGFQFRREQGQEGIENALLARGMGLSGSQLRGASEFNQNLASQEYGNWFNRLSGLAGIGQQASQSNINTAGQVLPMISQAQGQNAMAQGNIQGNMAQNLTGIAGSTMSNLAFQNALNQPNQAGNISLTPNSTTGFWQAPNMMS